MGGRSRGAEYEHPVITVVPFPSADNPKVSDYRVTPSHISQIRYQSKPSVKVVPSPLPLNLKVVTLCFLRVVYDLPRT